jgi:hypothetical protein
VAFLGLEVKRDAVREPAGSMDKAMRLSIGSPERSPVIGNQSDEAGRSIAIMIKNGSFSRE